MIYDTMAQKEALINEYKGNLFEYLVGSFLSRHFGIEREFLDSFGGVIKERFSHYESYLREHDPELIRELPSLAQASALELKSHFSESIQNILVMGKSAAGGGDTSWNEADLILVGEKKNYPISLKLCKTKAFVNTKSGGIKSFLSKYFSNFSSEKEWQQKLNNLVDESFLEMGHGLYELAGLEFSGGFDYQWVEAGYSELPGQLNPEMGQLVMQNYYKVIAMLYQGLESFLKESHNGFIESLAPLLGLGNVDILQLTCFHGEERLGDKKKRYQLKGMHFFGSKDFDNEVKGLVLQPLKDQISSFEIELSSLILQIRVKPMNKFTVPGLKVNCSVKQK